jgi:transposase
MESHLETLHKRVAGIDVHRMKHVVTVLIEHDDGALNRITREFGGFKRDLKAPRVRQLNA